MKQLSIILPVYNEEQNIPTLIKRLMKVLESFHTPYEVLFIDDGSTDDTANLIRQARAKNAAVKLISFSRNFGHQPAVTAGLDYATGEYIAILDADLQDPPEVLPQFFAKLDEGYDVVYAIRTKRKEHIIKRGAYSLFYRILKYMSSIDIPLDSGDFCVMTRRVAITMARMPERNRFVRGIRSWVGFRQTGLEYERNERFGGASKYSFRKLCTLATDGMLSFSYIPLRLMTFSGALAFLISLVAIIITVYMRIFTTFFVPGFATTVTLLLFSGGIIMFGLGIIGEYLARIYDEVKQRPPYVVATVEGFNRTHTQHS